MSLKVVIRTDASLEIGAGHVMRCLALAEALRREAAEVSLISRELPGNLVDQVESRGIPVIRLPAPDVTLPMGSPAHASWAAVDWPRDAEETSDILEQREPDWLVVDHYAFDERWEKALRRRGMRIMVVDDLADRPHDCDLLLDQNLGRAANDYKTLVPAHCTLLIGPMYALLRPEFAARRSESLVRRMDGNLEHVLVSMGGIDRDNVSGRVINAIQDMDLPTACRLTVVLGKNAPWIEDVKALAASSKVSTVVCTGVEHMAALMSEADLAIGGAGVSAWERCAVGLPSLIITMAENQSPIARAMMAEKAAVHVGTARCEGLEKALRMELMGLFHTDRLVNISERAARLCDGEGIARVLAGFMHRDISFREADLADSRRIFEWRQYPGHERFNRNHVNTGFADHHAWFADALVHPDREFRIVQMGGFACGYLRLDRLGDNRAAISICLSADARGKKLSRLCLAEGDRIALEMGIQRIDAEIHVDNRASIRAFQSAGYELSAESANFLQFQRTVACQ